MLKVFIIITNLMLYYFNIDIIINNSKLNKSIVDLRFTYSYAKINKNLSFNRVIKLHMSISILKKTNFINTSIRINYFYDIKLMSKFEI